MTSSKSVKITFFSFKSADPFSEDKASGNFIAKDKLSLSDMSAISFS